MVKVVQFIADISIWIYLVLAILGLILLRVIQVAVKERSNRSLTWNESKLLLVLTAICFIC